QHDQRRRTRNDAAGDAERQQFLEGDLASRRHVVVTVMSVMVVSMVMPVLVTMVVLVVGRIVTMAVRVRSRVALDEETKSERGDREPGQRAQPRIQPFWHAVARRV